MPNPKILLLPSYFPLKSRPIVGSQIKEQAELMLNAFDIWVLYCIPGMGWKRFVASFFYRIISKNPYKSLEDNFIDSPLKKLGVYYFNHRYLPQWLNLVLERSAYIYLYKQFVRKNGKPDLLHSRGSEKGGLMAKCLKEKFNLKYIHTENTAFLFHKNLSMLKINSYKEVLINADIVLFVSNFLKRDVLKHGFLDKKKTNIIGNSVNSNLFTVKQSLRENEKFRIMISGYHSYIKDYETFLNAISELRKLADFQFEVIIALTYSNYGDKETLELFADSLGVLDLCKIRTEVPRKEMPKLINTCDVFVSTSIIETFGISVMEALFCGVPVVATKNGGVEDYVTKENGLLCNIGDSEQIAKSIFKILKTTDKWNPEKIRETVVHKYDTNSLRSKLSSYYYELIE